MKLIFIVISALLFFSANNFPEVKVAGAMRNIMMQGNFKAYANLDTLSKANLYGLGAIEDLKGEFMVLNGEVLSSAKQNKKIVNKTNTVKKAALFVYSYVRNWKSITIQANINSYTDLEKCITTTAKENSIDTTQAFVFKIEATPSATNFHIIDWEKGKKHTMKNHKQFAYSGKTVNSNVKMLGFYSDHHHSVFTHHTTNMHIHILDSVSKNIGHLDDVKINGTVKIYLPVD